LGDIGMHFPDTDPAYLGASSMGMLETVVNAVESVGFRVCNVDLTVLAERPRISPFRAAIVENLAAVLKMEPERINVKAKTTEGMGFIGRGEGIAVTAVALLEEVDSGTE
jgi:2-C-methyl-D-erythritol 2,4-cyclodiphosphate synthase